MNDKRSIAERLNLCDVYDTLYDVDDSWIEGVCDDPECEFCANRPDKHPLSCPCLGK